MIQSKSVMWWSILGVSLISVLGVAGVVLGLGSGESATDSSPPPPSAPRVETILVVREPVERSIRLPGTVEGYEFADLYARIGGYLEEVRVDIGSEVAQDEILAVLRVPEMHQEKLQKEALVGQAEAEVNQAEAAIRQAEADLASAEAMLAQAQTELGEKEAQVNFRNIQFDRLDQLVRDRAAAAELLDEASYQRDAATEEVRSAQARVRTAQAGVRAAQAAVDKASADADSAQQRVHVANANLARFEAMMDYATIRAPYPGVITRRWLHPGAFIQPAEGNSSAKPLLSIARTDHLRIVVRVPMSEMQWVDRDDTAEVSFEGRPADIYTAQVVRFSPTLDEQTRTMRVELELKGEPSTEPPSLAPGAYIYANLKLVEYPDAPIVPAAAINVDTEGRFVLLVEDGMARRRGVTILYEDGERTAIASGLEGGEEVLTSGRGQITPGQQVVPVRGE